MCVYTQYKTVHILAGITNDARGQKGNHAKGSDFASTGKIDASNLC